MTTKEKYQREFVHQKHEIFLLLEEHRRLLIDSINALCRASGIIEITRSSGEIEVQKARITREREMI